jgi:H+/gluconate symporter-like permease
MLWHELSISEDVKKMLDTLKERKEKMDSTKKIRNRYFIFLFSFICIFFIYFYSIVIPSSKNNALNIIEDLLNSSFNVLFLIIVVTTYTFSIHYSKKASKAKNKFDDLRLEVIERLYSTWIKTNNSEIRDKISRAMASQGINLTYKSK